MPEESDEGTQPAEEVEPERLYRNAEDWLWDWGLQHFRRNPKRFLWDERWWEYPESCDVIEALWMAFEHFRLDGPTGMAVYFRDYFYPLMRELTGEDGPFWRTRSADKFGGRQMPEVWPAELGPAEMYGN